MPEYECTFGEFPGIKNHISHRAKALEKLKMQLSGEPVFFGDPVSLDEGENTLTFWHCGAAACSLARHDTGAAVGVHPNRKIGPAMDFGCEAFPEATVFRVGREPDGSFRFFILEGEALDKPKQFIGTSIGRKD